MVRNVSLIHMRLISVLIGGDILTYDKEDRNFIPSKNARWPNNTVYYRINIGFWPWHKDEIRASVKEMEKALGNCIKFIELSDQDKHLPHFINIYRGDTCHSNVGYLNFERYQELSLGPGCVTRSVIVHEFSHALGFFHEHNRPDRNQHVKIHFENVTPNMAHNFKIETDADTVGLPYDYQSIMHYTRKAFSNNSLDTIVPLEETGALGNTFYSELDIKKIRKYYEC
ncbi:Low choriolytic enzyme [Nymphon striatum]|nr:Low choriolytic enzyme [Nymphon striatum]